MPRRTSFRIHKGYSSLAEAEEAMQKLQERFPDASFSIKKKTWPGKLKQKFLVRSVVRRGSK